jgi:hypothetical protein
MRNTATTNSTTATRSRKVLAAVRDELRERRQARRDYRALASELASYNTRSDVDDLLATLENDRSIEATQIRTILMRNLARNAESITKHPLAS